MTSSRITFQRDFYHLLLRLATEHLDLETCLREALQLISEVTEAERAYLEVRDSADTIVYQSLHIDDHDIADLQQAVSSGIIAEAIKTRVPILIPSALVDPRFQTRESVQRLAIESVLCVPFFGEQTQGVLYLQGDKGFKDEAEKIKLDAELFAQHVAPLLDQLLIEQERTKSKSPIESVKRQHDLSNIIGDSPTFAELLQSAMIVAKLEVNTLLLGETGTGKTQLARTMHDNSLRRDNNFVEVNCAALPENLVENELFGAVAGGHSSATSTVTGKITAAHEGTLFLDEVGELPLESQAKLLQFIQSGEYYPLGAPEIHRSDARLIFATNRDLKARVKDGTFREDLYFRISTFELTLPTLNQRKTDIPQLANFFLAECESKHGFTSMNLDASSIEILSNASIEGNIRGLQNIIERSCIAAVIEKKTAIQPSHLPDLQLLSDRSPQDGFHTATLDFQKNLLAEELSRTNWNISKTARNLELSRSHVHNLINNFQLSRH